MVFDLGTTQQSFPFVQVFFGGAFLWLGMNLRIVRISSEDKTDE